MKDLHPQFELLISYADGLADSDRREQAEALIRSDAEAADFYQSLQASTLAFHDVNAEPLAAPQRVIDAIEQARPVDAERSSFADNPQAGVIPLDTTRGTSTGNGPPDTNPDSANASGTYGNLALAASLICGLIGGAVIYGSVVRTGATVDTGAPAVTQAPVTNTVSDPVSDAVPEWVRLVADYHRLYVRETVTAGAASSAGAVSKQVSETLQTDFSVPALESHGMEFRRAQWLAIDEQPLLQLAYLPETGKPLAVCVLKKSVARNSAAEYGETGGMQYVHWQSGQHAVVVVGTVSQPQLREIHSIVERELL